MVERICPQCQHGNPLENRFCGACGTSLDRNELMVRPETSLTIGNMQLPVKQVQQVGRAVALGVAAIAAEAGMAWLKRRFDQAGQSAPQTNVQQPLARTTPVQPPSVANQVVTIVSQKVIEIWEQGDLKRQVVEKHIWRKEQ
jgi:hypothetical protein